MKVDEAREKFGRTKLNDEGVEVWEPNPNKVRGMIMKHARACDEITGPSDEPDVEHYIDDLWQWLQDKLGEGFEALFQGDEMSPSGRFDRIGKDNLKGFTKNLYKTNEDYKEIVNDKWTVVDTDNAGSAGDGDTDFVGEAVTGDLAALSEMGHDDKILEFYVISDDPGPGIRGKKEAPSVGMYKHYMVEYAIQVNGIPANSDSPNAEDFVSQWIDWLGEHVFMTTGCIIQEDSAKYADMFETPVRSDVVGWARDLWKKNERFRKELEDKWGDSCSDKGIDNDGNSGLAPIQRPERTREKKRDGQVKLGDYA